MLWYASALAVIYLFFAMIQFAFIGALGSIVPATETGAMFAEAGISLTTIPVNIVFAILGLFIGVGLTFVFARLFGGDGEYTTLVKVYGFVGGAQQLVSLIILPIMLVFLFLIGVAIAIPVLFVLVIPLLLAFIIAILVWQLYIHVLVVSTVMHMSKGRALLALITPGVILIGIGAVLFLLFIGLIAIAT